MAERKSAFSRNYALYLAAGYQNDLEAMRHALLFRKVLQTISFGDGYRAINEALPYNVEYQADWRPYANKTVDGFTAAHQAAARNFKGALDLLFQFNWDCTADDGRGKTPADYAFDNGHVELYEWILDRAKFQKQCRQGDKYLRKSMTRGDVTLQEFLVRIEYVRRLKSGKIVAGKRKKAIKLLWTKLMQKKAKDLSVKEKDFNKILSKISMDVDGLELELPMSEADMKKHRVPQRKHIDVV